MPINNLNREIMIFNIEERERIELLQLENRRLLYRLEAIEEKLKIKPDLIEYSSPCGINRYEMLRSKYRSFKKEFNNKF